MSNDESQPESCFQTNEAQNNKSELSWVNDYIDYSDDKQERSGIRQVPLNKSYDAGGPRKLVIRIRSSEYAETGQFKHAENDDDSLDQAVADIDSLESCEQSTEMMVEDDIEADGEEELSTTAESKIVLSNDEIDKALPLPVCSPVVFNGRQYRCYGRKWRMFRIPKAEFRSSGQYLFSHRTFSERKRRLRRQQQRMPVSMSCFPASLIRFPGYTPSEIEARMATQLSPIVRLSENPAFVGNGSTNNNNNNSVVVDVRRAQPPQPARNVQQ